MTTYEKVFKMVDDGQLEITGVTTTKIFLKSTENGGIVTLHPNAEGWATYNAWKKKNEKGGK
jgi:hypothetical protein